MFLALAMIRHRWLMLVRGGVAGVHAQRVSIVWLGIGLLFYPAKLMFWQPVVDGLAMTAVFIVVMALFSAAAPQACAACERGALTVTCHWYLFAGGRDDGEG